MPTEMPPLIITATPNKSWLNPEQGYPGDIGAVAKIEEIHTGDVLHDDHSLTSAPWPPRHSAATPAGRRSFTCTLSPSGCR